MLNGMLLPVILVFILLLINDRQLVVGSLRNGRLYNILGWGSVVLVGGAAGVLVINQVLGLFGLGFFRLIRADGRCTLTRVSDDRTSRRQACNLTS